MIQDFQEINSKIDYIMLRIPNIPNPEVPDGETDEDNIEIKRWGETPIIWSWEPKAHWDLGIDLNIIDSKEEVKLLVQDLLSIKVWVQD